MEEHLSELFPLVFDSISEGVFTVDSNFRITSFNSSAERIIGVAREEALGRPCHEVFRASICQDGCALKETLRTGDPQRDVRVDVLNARMEQVPISVSTAVLKEASGGMVGGVEIFRDLSDVETLRTELMGKYRFENMVGASPAMRKIFAVIPQIGQSDAPVMIRGDSGTGKELVARAIHHLSRRDTAPFVGVNCGALPDTLLESELFGYVKGAFTGAVNDKPGRFQQANGGTLFLDEIGDTSPAFQVKLLRALEEGEVQPLGGSSAEKVDVRLICATNRDLESLVKEGSFREDLYYRIRVLPVELAPLRERREDIPLLVAHFCKLISATSGRPAPKISRAAMRRLYDYDYPGNVRELRNILERAFVLCSQDRVEPECLPPEVAGPTLSGMDNRSRPSDRKIIAAEIPGEVNALKPEARKLLSILDAHGWNRSSTARELGIGRTTLWRRMKDYGLI